MRVAALATALALAAPPVPLAGQDALRGAGDAERPPAAPLFSSQEPIELRIEADFHQLRRDREEENEERPGTVVFSATGDTLSADIRTRGRFRLQSNTCAFPPLRLDFPKSRVEGTVLAGQDKLKLVTHCRDRDDYEQNILQELLAYRIYNLLTDRSFQVRLARITYVDVTGREDTVERWGFLIEHEDQLAARLGGEILEVDQVHPAQIRSADAAPLVLFQYMIGNTDFSVYAGHNVVHVQTPETIVPVPFDFDWSGLVDASYARPDPSLGTRNVRDRVYRGLCRADVDMAALFARFETLRPEVEALIAEQVGLTDRERRETLEYVEGFYEVLGSERRRDRDIVRSCRSV